MSNTTKSGPIQSATSDATVAVSVGSGYGWKVWAFSLGVLFMALGAIVLVASIIAGNILAAVISGLITGIAIWVLMKNANWADM